MGRLSVVDSLFSTNSAGTDNVENSKRTIALLVIRRVFLMTTISGSITVVLDSA